MGKPTYTRRSLAANSFKKICKHSAAPHLPRSLIALLSPNNSETDDVLASLVNGYKNLSIFLYTSLRGMVKGKRKKVKWFVEKMSYREAFVTIQIAP